MFGLFVDPASLHVGAGDSSRAGEHAHRAAEHLSRGSLPAQIFGDFAAAEAFHETTGKAHAHHVRALSGHRETLTGVGHAAHAAAAGFAGMDEHNAASIRTLRCNSAT